MGKAQSKRSVDITTEATSGKVVNEEGIGKMEKIEDIDQLKPQGNGDTLQNDNEKTVKEQKVEVEEVAENEKDKATEKETKSLDNKEKPNEELKVGDGLNETTNGTDAIKDNKTVAENGDDTKNESGNDTTVNEADENNKKPKKEKVKKRWSFRSFSFSKKDKQKPEKKKEEVAVNGECEKVPEEATEETASTSVVASPTEPSVPADEVAAAAVEPEAQKPVEPITEKKDSNEKPIDSAKIVSDAKPEPVIEKPVVTETATEAPVKTIESEIKNAVEEPQKIEIIAPVPIAIETPAKSEAAASIVVPVVENAVIEEPAAVPEVKVTLEVREPELVKETNEIVELVNSKIEVIDVINDEVMQAKDNSSSSLKEPEIVNEIIAPSTEQEPTQIPIPDVSVTTPTESNSSSNIDCLPPPPPLPTLPPPSPVLVFAESALSTNSDNDEIQFSSTQTSHISEQVNLVIDNARECVDNVVVNKNKTCGEQTIQNTDDDKVEAATPSVIDTNIVSIVTAENNDIIANEEVIVNETQVKESAATSVNNIDDSSSDDPKMKEQIEATIALIEKVTDAAMSPESSSSTHDQLNTTAEQSNDNAQEHSEDASSISIMAQPSILLSAPAEEEELSLPPLADNVDDEISSCPLSHHADPVAIDTNPLLSSATTEVSSVVDTDHPSHDNSNQFNSGSSEMNNSSPSPLDHNITKVVENETVETQLLCQDVPVIVNNEVDINESVVEHINSVVKTSTAVNGDAAKNDKENGLENGTAAETSATESLNGGDGLEIKEINTTTEKLEKIVGAALVSEGDAAIKE